MADHEDRGVIVETLADAFSFVEKCQYLIEYHEREKRRCGGHGDKSGARKHSEKAAYYRAEVERVTNRDA